MDFDLRLLMSLGAVFASVVASYAVVRSQVERLKKDVDNLSKKISNLDTRLDKNDVTTGATSQRLDIFAQILSPKELRDSARQIERLRADLDNLMR